MSQVSLRLIKLFMVLLCLSLLSACGGKDEDEGKNNEIPECKIDEDCESYEQCTSNETCIPRTSCSKAEHCTDGKACIDGACEVAECKINEDCAFGSECTEGQCHELPRQCTAVGQSCVADRLAREGFACVDLGDGFKCQAACTGGPGVNKCATGSICVDRKYCQPSECTGPITGQAACDAIAAADPGTFQHGASCAEQRDNYGNKANMCIPAGTVQVGEECNTGRLRCEAGLLCVPGIPAVNSLSGEAPIAFCAEPCDASTTCSVAGEACIGASTREFSGGGICGNRCEPYKAGEITCSDGKNCVPVTKDDGICTHDTDPEAEIYSKCDPNAEQSECPSGTWCFGVTEDEARCLPLCDPTRPTQDDQDATCPKPDPKSFARIAHMAEGVAAVDVYLGATKIAEGLGFGLLTNSDDFIELPVGKADLTVRLSGDTDVIYTQSITLVGNEALNFAIVGDVESTEDVKIQIAEIAEPREVEAAVGETTELRVVHAVTDLQADSLDVVLVRADEDVDVEANRQRLGTAVAFGSASGFTAIESNQVGGEAGDVLYDVYFYKAAETIYLAKIAGLKVTTGQIATVYLVGTEAAASMKLVEHAVADKARILGGHCLDLLGNQGLESKAGLGICFENCTNNTHVGGGVCSGGGVNACDPRSPEQMWCFPSGQNPVGGACSGSADCEDGLFCDVDGAGSGTCRSYCEHKEDGVNPALVCDAGEGEVCVPIRGFSNLGKCRIGCDGGSNYSDDSCPDDQKSCFGEDKISYCQGSGPTALGAECENPTIQSCVPGAVCAKRVPTFSGLLTESFLPLAQGEVAYCRALCTPFLGPNKDSGCGEGFACSPILPGGVHSPALGHCVESGPELGSDASCTGNATGKMCGDNAYCVEGICVRLCEADSRMGCLANEQCRSWGLFDVYDRCQ